MKGCFLISNLYCEHVLKSYFHYFSNSRRYFSCLTVLVPCVTHWATLESQKGKIFWVVWRPHREDRLCVCREHGGPASLVSSPRLCVPSLLSSFQIHCQVNTLSPTTNSKPCGMSRRRRGKRRRRSRIPDISTLLVTELNTNKTENKKSPLKWWDVHFSRV